MDTENRLYLSFCRDLKNFRRTKNHHFFFCSYLPFLVIVLACLCVFIFALMGKKVTPSSILFLIAISGITLISNIKFKMDFSKFSFDRACDSIWVLRNTARACEIDFTDEKVIKDIVGDRHFSDRTPFVRRMLFITTIFFDAVLYVLGYIYILSAGFENVLLAIIAMMIGVYTVIEMIPATVLYFLSCRVNRSEFADCLREVYITRTLLDDQLKELGTNLKKMEDIKK